MNKKNIAVVLIILLVLSLSIIFAKAMKRCPLSQIKSGSASSLFAQAKALEAKGEIYQAKLAYQKLINNFSDSNEIMNWQKKIENLNIKLLFSSLVIPGSVLYEIKPGDTLNKIAKEFNTTIESIIKSNNLPNDRITPGKKIKVWTMPFSILVDKSQNILILKTKEEEIIKTYVVSTGLNNSTPVGNFKIVEKISNPPWFKPGATKPIPAGSPENILGTRWLGLSLPSYGIHGTVDPQSLGKQVTQGCVRMNNMDVEELFMLVPKGTEVTIVD